MAVVIFDLDKTLTKYDTYVRFLLSVLTRYPARIIFVLHLPVVLLAYKLGLFDNSRLKELFLKAFCGGLSRAQMDEHAKQFADRVAESGLLANGQRELHDALGAGYRVVIASASLAVYVLPLAQKLGIPAEDVVATEIVWDDMGRVAGRLDGPNRYGKAKLDGIKAWSVQSGLDRIAAAYSDHHSDLPLLLAARRGVAINPTPRLKAEAGARGFDIETWS